MVPAEVVPSLLLHLLLLSFALGFFALGLLTMIRSPDWNPWRLALLAGEFGHWLAGGALALAWGAWLMRSWTGGVAVTTLTLVFALGAVMLLLKPVRQARKVADWAKRDLDRISAPVVARAPFSAAGLFERHAGKVSVETMVFSGKLALDFYPAVRRGSAPAACVVVVHGGGWDSGGRDQLSGFNQWFALHGYAVAAISYRLAPEFIWPAQRDDTLAAIAFLKANATRLEIDATRLVLLGRSAGGQIAECVAYGAHDPAIRGVVGLYAPSDLNFAYKYARDDDVLKSPALIRRFLGGGPETAKANFDDASALRHVAADSPPTLLIHGKNDTLVWFRHSVRLEAALERVGVPCVLVALPWATHAFEYNLSGPGGQLTTYALERFLAKVTK